MPRQPLTDDEINHTRRRILREAAMIVGKGGIAGLSMRTLAQRLGLTPGALYRYFPSKQEMLLSYWEDALQAVADRAGAIDRNEPDAPSAIVKMLHTYSHFCLEDQDRFRLLFLEHDQEVGPEFFRRVAGYAPYDLLLKRVSQAIREGYFRTEDPGLLTQTLWAGVHGAVTLLITVKELDLVEPEDLIMTTITALMRGLSAKEI
ncbi:TetR/AcrR family transcriptional regulator [Brucella anthropi]|uniref:TetR/AcrR family transcriptional regulator n=2 Tax=Brucella anthropi TaxID=529 RepID=UPI003EE1D48B